MQIARLLLTAVSLAALGCSGVSDLPGNADGGVDSTGDGGQRPDAGTCEQVASCSHVFSYPAGGATMVELRGSFAEDGWSVGRPMSRNGDNFEVTLELDDGEGVEYKFVVDGEWVTDPNNSMVVDDGFGNSNSYVVADCDDCDVPPTSNFDWRDGIMYFVMIDRFLDGNSANNSPVDNVATPANFQGGDLAGVLQKIEAGYFTELGINILWLTAPIDNSDGAGAGIGGDNNNYSSYHGYWPSKLDAVETRIGEMADLKAVVDAAHAKGIKVVLDYVMNHVHTESEVYQQHQNWFWPLDNCLCGGGCSWDDDWERKKCWFAPYLADFDFNNAEARDFSVSNAIKWAKDTGIDGYRLDAVKHIETSWITELRGRIKNEVGDNFYMVGETYTNDRGLIKDFVNPSTMLDGQFDFPLRAEIVKAILSRHSSMGDLVSFMDSNQDFYGEGSVMGTFIGNHDVPRSIHLAEDGPLFGEWDSGKDRGWSNQPGQPDYERPFQRMAVAYALLMTTPGVPLIYYGDEVGLAGGGDPDNRRFMQWDNLNGHQSWLKGHLSKLTSIRSSHSALRRGSRQSLGASADVYVYKMSDAGDEVFVALNRGDDAQGAEGLPGGNYTDLITGDAVSVPMSIPARSALILVKN